MVRWRVEKQFAFVERNEKYIGQAIIDQVSKQEFDMIPVLDSLSLLGSLSINNLAKTTYPFFIYQEGELKYWSDFKFVPEYSDIKGTKKHHFIDKPYGQFIVRKWLANYKDQSFEVYSLITLYRKYPINNFYIQSKLNSKIGQKGSIEIASSSSEFKGYTININGNSICKIKLEKGYKPAIVLPIIYIDFFLLILQIILYYSVYKLVVKRKKWLEVIVLLLGWTYFKIVFPLMEGTTVFADINLFDPQYYAVSWFERSIADLLINTIFILLISFRLGVWAKNKQFLKIFIDSKNRLVGNGLMVIMTLLSFWIINYPFFQIRSIYDNSQVSIDISQSLEFGWTRIIAVVIVILVSLSTFLLYNTLVRHLVKFIPNSKSLLVNLLLSFLLFLFFSFMANMPFGNLSLVNILLIVVIWYFNLTRSLNSETYKRFLYIVLFFGILSGSSAYFIGSFETQKKINETNNIVEKKLAQSDPFGEFLLSNALKDLSSDQFIKSRFASPFLSKNTVISKIKQVFLNSYLNKYEQSIVLFDAKGTPLKNSNYNYSLFERLRDLDNPNTATEYKEVFRINDEKHDFSKHYLGYVSIKNKNNVIGFVLVELVEKQFSPALVYPSLLVDNRFGLPITNETSFAFYLEGTMVNTIGANEFPLVLENNSHQVWLENNFLYVANSDDRRSIIASTPLSKRSIVISNFSFIWVITLFPILMVWFVIPFLTKGEIKSFSYTERIIWYLNLAFIIPLILVTTVTFRLLSNSFEIETNLTKTTLVERLTNQISFSLSKYLNDPEEFDNLVERIEILSDNTELDINLFDLSGTLITSSQPGVFNKKVLAPYINQYALTAIKEKGKNHLVLQENIDQLKYENSYVAVKSEDTGAIMGIISVPFFSSNSSLNSSKREAFNTILNVFVIVLFATMLATYFAGKWLTKPLKIIGEKLKSTSFSKQTEPINIHSNDELGMLIKSYNQMLNSLELSKNELKQSEKEKAWREAAQQVAHEIKNPLTPMKLTLQRISKKIKLDDAKPEELEMPLQSVLHQVETLNSIASSFSEFAKMPTPVVKRIEVHAIIRKTVELFSSEKELALELQLADQDVYSMLDPKLIARMLNNLLLNAKQSIKQNQDIVNVKITTRVTDSLLILIEDNGAGIDSEIADKVFIPKFTTKEQGSGIGLAMTKFGIENMHGKIDFTSEIDVGTTFTIEFPITD